MRTDIQILTSYADQFRIEVIDNQLKKGLRASGKSAESLKVETPGRNQVQVVDHSGSFDAQEYGVAPPHYAPFKVLFDWVWLKKYGITFTGEKQQAAIVFGIQKKQKREGTYTHRKGKQTGVVTDIVVNTEGIETELADKYGNAIADAMVDILLDGKQSSDFNIL